MKHGWLLLLLCVMLVPFSACADFSESSMVYDPELAQYALQIAELCYTPSMQKSMLSIGGYRQVGVFNAERSENDSRHVVTYAVYDRTVETGATEVIIAIRGTGSGEWKLNMDLMPSGNYDLPYAENFFLAAEDILTTQADYLSGLSSPAFLVTGHSRGAAVANILGAELTERFGESNVFVYTFATPRTVRGEYKAYGNIYNIINPADLVTYLPLPQWGFERYGIDIELPVENTTLLEAAQIAYAARADQFGAFPVSSDTVSATQRIVSTMAELAPDPALSATAIHAMSHPGLASAAESGMTANAFMLTLFEGNLFTASGTEGGFSNLPQGENDFTPLLLALQSADSGSWLMGVHMPATYGAWMTVASNMQLSIE